MAREIAATLMALAVATDQPIAKMFEVVELIEDDEVKERFKTAVGTLMGTVFGDIILPIETLFPDLNPDSNGPTTVSPETKWRRPVKILRDRPVRR